MLMANDRSDLWSFEDLSTGDDDIDLSIDRQSFWEFLGESPGPDTSQYSPEDLSVGKAQQVELASDVGNNEHSLLRLGFPELEGTSSFGAELADSVKLSPSHNSEVSDFRPRASDGSFESSRGPAIFDYRKQEPSAQTGSSASCSGSLADWMLPVSGHDSLSAGSNGVILNVSSYGRSNLEETQYETPNCSTTFRSATGDANNASDFRDALDSNLRKGETEFLYRRLEGDTHSHYGSLNAFLEKSDFDYGKYCASSENSLETSMMNFDVPLPLDQHDSLNFQFMSDNDEMLTYIKDELEELPSQTACKHGALISEAGVGKVVGAALGAPMTGNPDVSGSIVRCEGYSLISPTRGTSFAKTDDRPIVNKASSQPLPRSLWNMCSKKQVDRVKDERNDELALELGMANSSYDVIDDTCSKRSPGVGDGFPADKGSRQLLSPILPSNSSKKLLVHANDEKEDQFVASKRARQTLDDINETAHRYPNAVADNPCLYVKSSEQPCAQPSTSMKQQLSCTKDERQSKLIHPKSMDTHISKVSYQTIQSNDSYHVDEESDICIHEDISDPSHSHLYPMNGKSLVTSQRTTLSDDMGIGGVRLKANDERLIFRVVLQDLSQPKTEASPPDGVLAVSLLRHQRIALSWMVQKETASLHCSGGILADDQGLGKTISTIALILKERAPTSRACRDILEHNEMETLNLDEDDDCVSELNGLKQDVKSCQVLSNGSSMNSRDTFGQAKGRPAAGTLVVCPTSVLANGMRNCVIR